MVFLQFQHSCLVTISYNFQPTEGGEKCWLVLSFTTLLAKSEKLIHAPFMLLNSLPWTDSSVDMGTGSLSIFAWCYSEDTWEPTTQCAMEAFFPWPWYLLDPLQSLGDLVTQVSCFFHLGQLHLTGCRASPGPCQTKLLPNLSLNFISYSYHMQNLVVWSLFCLFFF